MANNVCKESSRLVAVRQTSTSPDYITQRISPVLCTSFHSIRSVTDFSKFPTTTVGTWFNADETVYLFQTNSLEFLISLRIMSVTTVLYTRHYTYLLQQTLEQLLRAHILP